MVIRDFHNAFEKADELRGPTSPSTAFKFGEKMDDPLAMYMNDIATIPANLAGVPRDRRNVHPGRCCSDARACPSAFQFIAPQQAKRVHGPHSHALRVVYQRPELVESWHHRIARLEAGAAGRQLNGRNRSGTTSRPVA